MPPYESGWPSWSRQAWSIVGYGASAWSERISLTLICGRLELGAADDHRDERAQRARRGQRREQVGLLGDVRGRRVGDRPAELQLRRELLRVGARGPQRRVAALRVAGDQVLLADVKAEITGGADDVDDAAARGLADQVGVDLLGGAEAAVVGAHDRIAGLDPLLDLRIDVGDAARHRAAGGDPAGGADVGDPGRPVREGDHRPALLRRLALRDADHAGHGGGLAPRRSPWCRGRACSTSRPRPASGPSPCAARSARRRPSAGASAGRRTPRPSGP